MSTVDDLQVLVTCLTLPPGSRIMTAEEWDEVERAWAEHLEKWERRLQESRDESLQKS